MELRTTDYQPGQRMSITSTYFHNYKLGQIVIIVNKDNYNYHVRSEDKHDWWWVSEDQITPENTPVIFETDKSIKASYYFTVDGLLRIEIMTKSDDPIKNDFSKNDARVYFENNILPNLIKKHISQE